MKIDIWILPMFSSLFNFYDLVSKFVSHDLIPNQFRRETTVYPPRDLTLKEKNGSGL
jgi:hypothetical protein